MPLILCLDLNHVNPGHNKKKSSVPQEVTMAYGCVVFQKD